MQVEKAARESEVCFRSLQITVFFFSSLCLILHKKTYPFEFISKAEAIRKILGQDSTRKKREEKIKKRQEELAQVLHY